jgi:hypothetical protein
MIKSEDIELGGVCVKVFNDDCLNVLREMPDNSVDSIVTDPPYGISFMAKKWDYDVPSVKVWKEALRVLKPGGHALIACGTRTQHRMVCNIEDAGFEIRDVVSWIYGSGFPKSLNVSKQIDKAAGAEREVGKLKFKGGNQLGVINDDGWKPRDVYEDSPATEAAKQWDGWGTALKPACEFFTLCRKPLSEKTVAANVLKWGTGGINIDGCRVGTNGETPKGSGNPCKNAEKSAIQPGRSGGNGGNETPPQGRFPANLIHDGSQEVLDLFPETKPSKSGGKTSRTGNGAKYGMGTADRTGHDDQGSAARFFYCPKASKKDRNEGCEELEEKESKTLNEYKNPSEGRTASKSGSPKKNNHPTVKPTALMAYLCRLITPTGWRCPRPLHGVRFYWQGCCARRI